MRPTLVLLAALAVTGCTPSTSGDDGGGSGGGAGGGSGGGSGGGASDGGPVDLDVVVVRFNADGTLDHSFAAAGVAKVDLTTGAGTTRDNAYSVTRDAADRLIVFSSAKAEGRGDADRVVMRFTADGVLDPTFATSGKAWLDTGASDAPRHGFVQPDGKIVSSGYAPLATGVGTQTSNSVVLQRLEADGAVDTTFGTNGVVISNPFKPADPVNTQWGMAEAYGAVSQNGRYVTAGYGRSAPSGPVNMVSFRYLADGSFDTTWGTNGIVELDLVGADERGRNLVSHADGRVFVVGSGTPTTGNLDAMITALTPAGALDTSFNPLGYRLFSFNRADEAFFGTAISPTGSVLAAVGHTAGTGDSDDDSILALIPIATGAPAEVVRLVDLSPTGNDRLVSVAFDASGKIVASGFVVENGDSRVVVARFNPDGSLDPTFGSGGIATLNVTAGRTDEIARSVVVQSNGKIVIAGVADH
jgi:uncharacterized delta-60 repeat protein